MTPNSVEPTDPAYDARLWMPLRDTRRGFSWRLGASKEAAADQLIAAAERLRAEAYRAGDPTAIAQAQQLSRRMERAAIYLHGHTLDQMTDDAMQMVQSKSWQAVLIAFVVGVIFGQSLKRTQRR